MIYRHFSGMAELRSCSKTHRVQKGLRKLRDFLVPPIYERAVINQAWILMAFSVTAAYVLVAARIGYAQTKAGEGQQAAQAIEKALQKQGGDVHRCFEKVLADRLDAAGKVEVAVEVGKAGKVISAKVKKSDKNTPPALTTCIEKAALGWTIEGIEAGATVMLPFVFKPQNSQYLVNGADVPERALGAPAPNKAKPGPRRDVPFTVKVLADETNVKAEGISVTLLNVGPASRVAMHRHAHSAKILYLVKGHARLLGPEGTPPVKLDDGTAAFIPAGYPHVIENMGRQSTAIFLQVFSPPGPERVYRDPKDERGRSEFEVIRDPTATKVPPEANGKVVVATAADAKVAQIPRNLGIVKSLIDMGSGRAISLALLEWVDGAELQGKGDVTSNEVLYFLSGTGTLKIANETLPLAAESMVYLPKGISYTMKFAAVEKGDKIMAVQFKVPAPAKARSALPATPRK
jgi:mannose-6-phosphate isomerase-like protein (cupin superfamily)